MVDLPKLYFVELLARGLSERCEEEERERCRLRLRDMAGNKII